MILNEFYCKIRIAYNTIPIQGNSGCASINSDVTIGLLKFDAIQG